MLTTHVVLALTNGRDYMEELRLRNLHFSSFLITVLCGIIGSGTVHLCLLLGRGMYLLVAGTAVGKKNYVRNPTTTRLMQEPEYLI